MGEINGPKLHLGTWFRVMVAIFAIVANTPYPVPRGNEIWNSLQKPLKGVGISTLYFLVDFIFLRRAFLPCFPAFDMIVPSSSFPVAAWLLRSKGRVGCVSACRVCNALTVSSIGDCTIQQLGPTETPLPGSSKSCFSMTLRAVARRAQLPFLSALPNLGPDSAPSNKSP